MSLWSIKSDESEGNNHNLIARQAKTILDLTDINTESYKKNDALNTQNKSLQTKVASALSNIQQLNGELNKYKHILLQYQSTFGNLQINGSLDNLRGKNTGLDNKIFRDTSHFSNIYNPDDHFPNKPIPTPKKVDGTTGIIDILLRRNIKYSPTSTSGNTSDYLVSNGTSKSTNSSRNNGSLNDTNTEMSSDVADSDPDI